METLLDIDYKLTAEYITGKNFSEEACEEYWKMTRLQTQAHV